jgi:hypothetical protein
MTPLELHNLLISNNVKSQGFYTVDQLISLVDETSVNTPYNETAKVTLAYSGNLAGDGRGPSTTTIAEQIGKDHPTPVRTIGQTDAASLLLDPGSKTCSLRISSVRISVTVHLTQDFGDFGDSALNSKVRKAWSFHRTPSCATSGGAI